MFKTLCFLGDGNRISVSQVPELEMDSVRQGWVPWQVVFVRLHIYHKRRDMFVLSHKSLTCIWVMQLGKDMFHASAKYALFYGGCLGVKSVPNTMPGFP